jgi:RNA polymerase sigma-70 factor (ECF subfamily)
VEESSLNAGAVYYVPVETPDTDEAIALRVQQGDADVYGELVDRYEQKLMRYGTKFLARTEDIEDIVQDVFISAYRSIQSFDPSLRFSPWIYRIAHNAFVNALRKNQRGPVFMDFDTLLSHQVYEDPAHDEREQKEMRGMLDKGIEKLSEKYREVLVLHYFEELPYKDIADVLQIPVGTVSIRIKRAKEALKNLLHDI